MVANVLAIRCCCLSDSGLKGKSVSLEVHGTLA